MSDEHDKHHILSDKIGVAVFVGLLILTVITVAASRLDFGSLNFAVAMFIATTKAILVVLFFMGLKYDERDNKLFFSLSFLFIGFFIALTAADEFTRSPNWRVQGQFLKDVAGPSKYKKVWISTDELKVHGKKVFDTQCATCHGAEGLGNGPGGASLNPKPRNFHEGTGWTNGRKVSEVFMTLKMGLNSMPSFANLSTDDRWAVTHYILSLGPTPPEAMAEDLKKVGIIDITKDDGGSGGEAVKRKIPVDFAIDRYLESAKAK